jgi:hypothetical protein
MDASPREWPHARIDSAPNVAWTSPEVQCHTNGPASSFSLYVSEGIPEELKARLPIHMERAPPFW